MEIHNLEEILANHPFLKDWDPEHITLFAGCAKNEVFKAGQMIFKEGEPAHHFYILRDGQVRIQIRSETGPIVIQTIDGGEILGWSWFVPPFLWHFDARAIEQTRVLTFDTDCLRNKMEENHHFGYLVLKKFVPVILERLQATRLQLLDLYGVSKVTSGAWR